MNTPAARAHPPAMWIALICAASGAAWLLIFELVPAGLPDHGGWLWVVATALTVYALLRALGPRLARRDDADEDQQSLLTAIIQRAPQAMVVYNLDGSVRLINDHFLVLFGYTFEDLSHLDQWWPLAYPDPGYRAEVKARWAEQVMRSLDTDEPVPPTEAQVTCRDGSRRVIRFHLRTLGRQGVVIFEDLTEVRQLHQEHIALERQLLQRQKLESLGLMAGGIAHDFNNMLGVILGQGELLLEDDALATEQARQDVGDLVLAAERARDLVAQILLFSRQQEEERQPVSLGAAAEEALRMLRRTLPSTLTIVSDLRAQDSTVLASATQLHQVITNLCTNAAQATDDSGTVEVSVAPVVLEDGEHPALAGGPYVRLQVRDDGEGITPEHLDRIFEPFFTTRPRGEGTGMGMSVVHGIVHSHGGGLSVQSTPDEGTTVDVLLPRLPDDAPAPDDATRDPARAIPPMSRGTALIVDDEPQLALITARMVGSLGYEAISATSGEEALSLFQQEPSRFTLLVTDQTMPQMTGTELIAQVRALRPTLPIVLYTGLLDSVPPGDGERLGIRAVLGKPISIQQLAAAIDKGT